MNRIQIGLLLGVLLVGTTPVQAQLFSQKPRPNASQRVPELILIVKTDPDDRKRLHAVEELRKYDTAVYTEIAPVLVDVLKNDKKMSVRLETVNSLARMRPVHPLAAPALELAAGKDESWRVRWHARTTLNKLQGAQVSAKKGEKEGELKKPTTAEPPLADEPTSPLTVEVVPQPTPAPAPRPLPSNVKPAAPGQGPALFP